MVLLPPATFVYLDESKDRPVRFRIPNYDTYNSHSTEILSVPGGSRSQDNLRRSEPNPKSFSTSVLIVTESLLTSRHSELLVTSLLHNPIVSPFLGRLRFPLPYRPPFSTNRRLVGPSSSFFSLTLLGYAK